MSKYTIFCPKYTGSCPNCTENCPNSNDIFGNFDNLSPLKIQSQVSENECARIFLLPLLYPELFWKNYFFLKFGQEYVRIPPAPYLRCANLDRNLDNLDKFSTRLKWMTAFIHSYCKNDIILSNHPSTWCNTWM